MTPFTPTKPNRPRTSKRCTDRDLADIRGVFVRWCQDWEPKTD